MRLIKPSFQILNPTGYALKDIYKSIELASRTCYKSESYITEDSAEKFVNMIKDRQHTAMLEHGTVYLETEDPRVYYKYVNNQYSKVDIIKYTKTDSDLITPQNPLYERGYVTTNCRVLHENNWLDDLKYLCEPTKYHEKRITVKFVCDRGILAEFTRHRVFSFAAESSRYCNYSRSKFNNEVTFIIPCWVDALEGDYGNRVYPKLVRNPNTDGISQIFIDNCRFSEECYFRLLNAGWLPQQARSVLPTALKTELVMTGFVSDWNHFFNLRDAKSAHPQAYELAHPLHVEFIHRGYLSE